MLRPKIHENFKMVAIHYSVGQQKLVGLLKFQIFLTSCPINTRNHVSHPQEREGIEIGHNPALWAALFHFPLHTVSLQCNEFITTNKMPAIHCCDLFNPCLQVHHLHCLSLKIQGTLNSEARHKANYTVNTFVRNWDLIPKLMHDIL
jgi:hypothetical protein